MSRFRIDAIHDPQTLPRIAGLFAQCAIVPSEMRMERREGHLHIEVAVASLDPVRAAIISAKLSEMVPVIAVVLDQELVA